MKIRSKGTCRFSRIASIILVFPVIFSTWGFSSPAADDPGKLSGPVKIVKLLWNANPESAAKTLAGTIEKSLARGQKQPLADALEPLRELAFAAITNSPDSDPRYLPALSVALLLRESGSAQAMPPNEPDTQLAESVKTALLSKRDAGARTLLMQVWFLCDSESAFDYFEHTIRSDGNAAQPAELVGAAISANRTRTAKILFANWASLQPSTRLASIEPLSASQETMRMLIEAIRSGVASKDLVNSNQLRKWSQSPDSDLRTAIESVWGKIRETDNEERQRLVASTVELLNSGVSGSASRGNAVFTRVCSQCHSLHGQGFEVGPNIVGNGRGSLPQLVSNVLDPSLVIGEAFQARTVLTVDGEVVAGLVAAEDEQYLKLKVQGGKVIEFNKREDIEQIKTSSKSLMPEGVELQMTQQEMIDLFAFLCLLKPLGAADNELIPGTPENFVQP